MAEVLLGGAIINDQEKMSWFVTSLKFPSDFIWIIWLVGKSYYLFSLKKKEI